VIGDGVPVTVFVARLEESNQWKGRCCFMLVGWVRIKAMVVVLTTKVMTASKFDQQTASMRHKLFHLNLLLPYDSTGRLMQIYDRTGISITPHSFLAPPLDCIYEHVIWPMKKNGSKRFACSYQGRT
jgi:hypothetical protein